MNHKKDWKRWICSGGVPDILLCGLLSFVLEIVLEVCDWRSLSLFQTFFEERTWIFFYNCMIIFLTFIPVFLVRRKLFVYILTSCIWLVIGITNGIMLGYRNTPFSAVDIALLKSTLPVISNYMTPVEIVLVLLLLVALLIGLVCLFLYCPRSKKRISIPRHVCFVTLVALVLAGATKYGIEQRLLEDRFSNIRLAYRAYGTPYCFTVTLFDNGIDRPLDYTVEKVEKLAKNIEKKYDTLEKEEKKTPNIIFIQLESFFDVTRMKDLEFSEDPIPYFRSMKKQYTSGYISTPSYGAGTVNTEFEVMTGMNKNYFGAGEYPFKSVLQETTCESAAYVLKEDGYTAHAIHNNNASFYDRDYVYTNLGFDTFTTMELMNIMEVTPNKWAKDKVLTKYIMEALDSTENQDYIYTVSVQGHGDYPTESLDSNTIEVTGTGSESRDNQFAYYSQQIKEMDKFLEQLIYALERRDEETVLVVFGDHLPSLEIESEDLTKGNKYQTDYFIWDNIGLSKEDENLEAYQLYSKVFAQLGIGNGWINKYHQTYRGTKNYSENLKLLEYDMLYGSNFVNRSNVRWQSTDMRFGVKDIDITSINQSSDNNMVYFGGEAFTPYTRIYVNGVQIETEYKNRALILWKDNSLTAGDKIYLIQKSKTNQHPILWQSETWVYQEDGSLLLEEN